MSKKVQVKVFDKNENPPRCYFMPGMFLGFIVIEERYLENSVIYIPKKDDIILYREYEPSSFVKIYEFRVETYNNEKILILMNKEKGFSISNLACETIYTEGEK